jgi:hypothetical protein
MKFSPMSPTTDMCPASRDLLEIGIFDFQRHGPPARPGVLAAAPDLFHDRLQRIARRLKGEEVGGKGFFSRRPTS